MNITITQINKCYAVEFNGQRLILLNKKALMYHLKRKVGLDTAAAASVIHMFEYQTSVTFTLAAA